MPTTVTDKKRTTVYISEDVLEYLTIRRAKGAGSVSRQLEALAREQMPRHLNAKAVKLMEAQDVEGYRKQPLTDEVSVWQGEQVWDDE